MIDPNDFEDNPDPNGGGGILLWAVGLGIVLVAILSMVARNCSIN